ncbi:flippase [Anoxybacillus flavithermus]|uniref:Flippase n=1 Tax=Anoxybacillus flavithermus TaxID=33934 RepID=A0AAX2A2U2_9BACL|nr:flippase [Anoxybacillus flavithermus]MBE2919758.1 flippase [Anoxybacillus flavithermus]MBE2920987.1 flippase [Anoxybacillus flavithermus]RWU15148.1 flippase [Anoxybacillus flavithermus]
MTDRKKLIENFSALMIMQFLNYVLPFITLPYLARVLGAEKYGVYLFSQAFVQYFIILVDFGFDLSATREIALNRGNIRKISEIVSSVLTAKIFIAVISLFVLVSLVFLVPVFHEYWIIYVLTFGMIFGNACFSSFFYQGIEKMKFITILNASVKLFFTLAIFFFVRDSSDLFFVPLLNSIGYLLVGGLSLVIITRQFKVNLNFSSKSDVIGQIKKSSQFFWSRVAVSIYTTSNTFIIGLVMGPVAAGIFGSADKLFRGIISLYQPLNNVLYPYISHSKNIKLYKKLFYFSVLLNFVIVLIITFSSDSIIALVFGEDFMESSDLLKIFMLTAVFLMPSILLGYPLLGALGYSKEVNNSVIIASFIHVALLVVSIPFLSVKLVALYVLFTELFVFIYRIYFVKKYSLLKDDLIFKETY